MSAQFTAGPWQFEPNGYGYSTLWNPETRQEVLTTGGRNDGDGPVVWMGEELSDADRRLIEAAPAMFAALEEALLFLEMGQKIRRPDWNGSATPESVIGGARAALFVARGDGP